MSKHIEVIKNAGFCYGVQKAYSMTLNEIDKSSKNSKKIYSLGELIHNNQVIEELKDKGVKTVKKPEEITDKNSSVIIRAHGVPKEVMKKIKDKKIKPIDATCPYVKIPQNAVDEYNKKGYFVIIVGDDGHPEVIGIKSYADKDNYIITKTVDDLPIKELKKKRKVVIVSQTTLSFDILNRIVSHVILSVQEVIVINSICDATEVRQRETKELAKKSDIMIIIGGKHSANTKRLKEIASNYTKAYHIELETEIELEWFNNIKNIGISAGASTPNWIIEKVEKEIKTLLNL